MGDYLPTYRDQPPPPGLDEPVGGEWCGRLGHTPQLYRARSAGELARQLRGFVCPQCGAKSV